MAKTISNYKDDVTRKLHGTSLDKITGILAIAGEAAANILAKVDFMETHRSSQITNGLYDNVYDYAAPSDLKGNKITDIRRQVNRRESDNFTQNFAVEFDSRKENNSFQVKNVNGTKSVRISKDVKGTAVTVHTFESITSNGTWAVGDDATNLTLDTENYIKGGGSLNFDVDGSTTTGYIENSTMTQLDLSDHDEKSSFFLRVYVPDSSAITNVILRWGNSSSAYWSRTVTTNQEGGSLETGWNTLRFDWNGATETGTVDPTLIDYVRITVTYDGTADTDFRVDQLVSALSEIFYIDYYSKYLFKNSSGTYLETPVDDTDTINLDTDSYPIFLYESLYLIAQEIQGEDSGFDATYFAGKREELINEYKKNNTSMVIRPQSYYYRTKRRY